MKLSKLTEKQIVALTIMAEAEGESWFGKLMVADVIKNRSLKNCRSIREICLHPYQFSCWNTGLQKRRLVARLGKLKNSQAWKDCKNLAEMICAPEYKTTTPATHYFNPAKANPKWANSMQLVVVVGNHNFYREKPVVLPRSWGNIKGDEIKVKADKL